MKKLFKKIIEENIKQKKMKKKKKIDGDVT